MSMFLRLLALAAALNIAAAGTAAAQTVLVKGAKPGETVDLVVNDAPAVSGKVGGDGAVTVLGTIPLNSANRPEMDARLYLDACENVRRVLVVDRNQLPPPPEAGCTRTEVSGIYWVRQRSTIVVDVSKPIADVLLRQGQYNPNAPSRRLAPKGLVAFGGGGVGKFSHVTAIACGDVTNCSGSGYVGAFNLGGTFWITRWLGVEGSYLRPSVVTTEGSGSTFTFKHEFDSNMVNFVGKLGIPVGPVRIYGQGGTTFHEATDRMVETIGGESQTVETSTDGWSYTFGGGIEAWISDRLALYGEAGRTKVKGEERKSGVIKIDDNLMHYMFGVRFRIF